MRFASYRCGADPVCGAPLGELFGCPADALDDPLAVVVEVAGYAVVAACGSTAGALFCCSVVLKSDFGRLLELVGLDELEPA